MMINVMKKELMMKRTTVILTTLMMGLSWAAAAPKSAGYYGKTKGAPKAEVKAHPFDLGQVKLLSCPFERALKINQKYLLEVDADRMLWPYHERAGLPTKGERYDSWERKDIVGQRFDHKEILDPLEKKFHAEVTINSKKEDVESSPESYLTLSRQWEDGDKTAIRLPMNLHLRPVRDKKDLIAIMYGPVVLAGELGSEGMPNDVTLIPLADLHHQRYPVYWQFLTGEAWEGKQAEQAAEERRLKVIAEATIDVVTPGTKLEKSHHQKGESSKPGHVIGFTYKVPSDLTKGKERVTVKFQAHPGAMAGGIFGCRIMTSNLTGK
jgi:hypothetical protein